VNSDLRFKEWLRRVNLVPELTNTPLSDADRTGHLPQLYFDLISRLRLAKDAQPPISTAGCRAWTDTARTGLFRLHAHGGVAGVPGRHIRHRHLHQSELDQSQLLLDVMVIADEVDAQLMETVRSLMGARRAEVVA
jgi:hypothetical protein